MKIYRYSIIHQPVSTSRLHKVLWPAPISGCWACATHPHPPQPFIHHSWSPRHIPLKMALSVQSSSWPHVLTWSRFPPPLPFTPLLPAASRLPLFPVATHTLGPQLVFQPWHQQKKLCTSKVLNPIILFSDYNSLPFQYYLLLPWDTVSFIESSNLMYQTPLFFHSFSPKRVVTHKVKL